MREGDAESLGTKSDSRMGERRRAKSSNEMLAYLFKIHEFKTLEDLIPKLISKPKPQAYVSLPIPNTLPSSRAKAATSAGAQGDPFRQEIAFDFDALRKLDHQTFDFAPDQTTSHHLRICAVEIVEGADKTRSHSQSGARNTKSGGRFSIQPEATLATSPLDYK